MIEDFILLRNHRNSLIPLRCHQAQKNIPQQAQELHLAGSVFWEQALDESILSVTDFSENTEEAIHCYFIAINVCFYFLRRRNMEKEGIKRRTGKRD
jgi:hypothetical protein